MFLLTLWVNTKLKFSVPRAGRDIPSIFCRTQGPTSVSVVVPAGAVVGVGHVAEALPAADWVQAACQARAAGAEGCAACSAARTPTAVTT